jgi:hypothetical protein
MFFFEPVEVQRESRQQRHQVGRLPFAGHIAFRKAD